MAEMRNFEQEALAAVRSGEHRIAGLFHHAAQAASQTPAPGPVTLASAPPEENPVSVSVLTEAKTIAHDLIDKLESVDEDGQNVIEAIRVSPTAISITNTLASIAHIPDPDGDLTAIDSLLKVVGVKLTQAAQATAPADAQGDQASFTPAGPQVAGQA